MAQTNRVLAPDVDTMFLTTSLEYAYLSSTTVKEVAMFGGRYQHSLPLLRSAEAVRAKMYQLRNRE